MDTIISPCNDEKQLCEDGSFGLLKATTVILAADALDSCEHKKFE